MRLMAGVVALLLLVAGPAGAGETRITVIQYNIQLLFDPALRRALEPFSAGLARHFPATAGRAGTIGARLACADIVFLNESASDELRAELISAMEAGRTACPETPPAIPGGDSGRPFTVVDGPDLPGSRGLLGHVAGLLSGERLLDDELAIISRFSVVAHHQLIFSEAVGEDRWAAKGVLHARLWRGPGFPQDHTLDVFTSHFQAGDGAVHRRVRASQLAQTLAFIRRHNDPGTPVVFGGDLNMDGLAPDDGEYHRLAAGLRDLGLYDTALEKGVDQATDRAREERIDYIFHSRAGLQLLALDTDYFPGTYTWEKPSAFSPDPLPGHAGEPSDHAALIARFLWSPAR